MPRVRAEWNSEMTSDSRQDILILFPVNAELEIKKVDVEWSTTAKLLYRSKSLTLGGFLNLDPCLPQSTENFFP